MRSQLLFKKISVLLLALNVLACSVLTPAAATPSATEIEREEQAVYSFFVHGQSTALILEDTSTSISNDDPQKTVDYIKSGLKGVSSEALDNFLERNRQPGQLSPTMNLGVNYVLLTREDLSKISGRPNWGELLSGEYPGTYGYVIFSRVGFNHTLDLAVIYVGSVGGPLMGVGYYNLMEKQNGQWILKDQLMAWIS